MVHHAIESVQSRCVSGIPLTRSVRVSDSPLTPPPLLFHFFEPKKIEKIRLNETILASSAPPQLVRPGRAIGKKTKKQSMKYTEIDKKAIRKVYQQHADQGRKCFSFTAEEKAMLERKMEEEGWTNAAAYIRYVLFGLDVDEGIESIIRSKDSDAIGRIMYHVVQDLTNRYEYYHYRYEKDMHQLYQEEGVNIKEWASVTNKWHVSMLVVLTKANKLLKRIALELGLDNLFVEESSIPDIDMEAATPEELDAIARKIMDEQIAQGLPNPFE